MRALVTDLDRTLTGPDLVPDPRALRRLQALREAGVRVVIASGRTLEHMLHAGLDRVTDALVAENGAVVRVPARDVLQVRAAGFPPQARRALGPLADAFSWGRVLGSGPRALAPRASELLRAGGVAHALEWNADEVMLLPPGVDKAVGATVALRLLDADPAAAWAIGDGENDLSLFRMAALSAAPAQAPEHVRAAASTRLVRPWADGFLDFTHPLLTEDGPPEPRRAVEVEAPEADAAPRA